MRTERTRLSRHAPVAKAMDYMLKRWDGFQRRGITSSVSVTSSPTFDSRCDPQHVHEVGAATTTRSRGRCSGTTPAKRAAQPRAVRLAGIRTAGANAPHAIAWS